MSETGIPTLEAFLASSKNNTDIELNDEPCAICLEPLVILVEENRPLVLPTLSCSAGHNYHYHCVHMELVDMQPEDEPKDRCPTCRRRLFANLECIREVYSWFVTRCMVWKMVWAPQSTSEPAIPSLEQRETQSLVLPKSENDTKVVYFPPSKMTMRKLEVWQVDSYAMFPDPNTYNKAASAWFTALIVAQCDNADEYTKCMDKAESLTEWVCELEDDQVFFIEETLADKERELEEMRVDDNEGSLQSRQRTQSLFGEPLHILNAVILKSLRGWLLNLGSATFSADLSF